MLDPSSPVPLYCQLSDELERRIRGGEYAVGSRIPSEHELAAQYHLGRPTVRQATEVLVRRGLLLRQRGAGTYVTEPRPEVDLFTLAGTLAAFERTGYQLRTRLLWPVKLRSLASDPEHPWAPRSAYGFVRLGTLEQTPVLVEELFLDPEVFAGLDTLSVGRTSLSRLVAEHYGIRPVSGRQTVRVAPAPATYSEALGVDRTRPVLCLRRWLDFPGAPNALFARMYCRTDEVELVQTLHPDQAAVSARLRGTTGAGRPERTRTKRAKPERLP
ncbi:MAG: GntR family transcriptional regulator [Polyangiaceae bacterium]|nr:GntR family transcriptional regulator [Polyangiaceae bacterium]